MSLPSEIISVLDQDDVNPVTTAAHSAQWLPKDQESKWDDFVLRQECGSIYHTVAWKKVIEQAFPHIRGRFLVLRDGDSEQIRGGLPIYQVRSWLLGNRLVSVPFASVCDPLIFAEEDWELLAPEFKSERARTNSKNLVVRAVLSDDTVPLSFHSESNFRHHTLLLHEDFDTLCTRFDKQSVRQKAEKARKAGVTVEERSDEGGMTVCHSLLAATRRRLALPPMPLRFFEALLENLCPRNLKIFLAYQKSKPIACHLILNFKDQWISEYSGNADGVISGANQILYLETIRQACAHGARKFSFGRTSTHSQGLLSYKRRWGTTEEHLTDYTLRSRRDSERLTGVDISSPEDSRLYRLCKLAIAKAPMPICKVIGNFCYRHLG